MEGWIHQTVKEQELVSDGSGLEFIARAATL